MHALRSGRFKLIDAPRPELYDLEDDPFEERNIYDGHRRVAEPMAARLASMAPALNARSGAGSAHRGHARVARAAWRAWLCERRRDTREPTGRTRPDPKDCMRPHASAPMHRTQTPTAVRGDRPTILQA